MPPTGDTTGQTTYQGPSPEVLAEQRDRMARVNQAIQDIKNSPYGRVESADKRRAVEELLRQRDATYTQGTERFPILFSNGFSLNVTLDELFNIASNPGIAKTVLSQAGGKPTEEDVASFQEDIRTKYPNIDQDIERSRTSPYTESYLPFPQEGIRQTSPYPNISAHRAHQIATGLNEAYPASTAPNAPERRGFQYDQSILGRWGSNRDNALKEIINEGKKLGFTQEETLAALRQQYHISHVGGNPSQFPLLRGEEAKKHPWSQFGHDPEGDIRGRLGNPNAHAALNRLKAEAERQDQEKYKQSLEAFERQRLEREGEKQRVLTQAVPEFERKINEAVASGEIKSIPDIQAFAERTGLINTIPKSVYDRYIQSVTGDYFQNRRDPFEAERAASSAPRPLDLDSVKQRIDIEKALKEKQNEGITVAPLNQYHQQSIDAALNDRRVDERSKKDSSGRLKEYFDAIPNPELSKSSFERALQSLNEMPSNLRDEAYSIAMPEIERMSEIRYRQAMRNFDETYGKPLAAQYASMGLHKGSALRENLNKARAKLMERLQDSQDVYASQAFDRARNYVLQERQSHIGKAQSQAALSQAPQQQRLLGETGIAQPQRAQNLAQGQAYVSTLSQAGQQQQAQEQREIDTRMKQQHDERMLPLSLESVAASISRGHHVPSLTQTLNYQGAPPVPSAINSALGGLASAAALSQQQRDRQQFGAMFPQQFASGGTVNNNEEERYRRMQEEMAKNLLNDTVNPTSKMLSNIAKTLFAPAGQKLATARQGMQEMDNEHNEYMKSIPARRMAIHQIHKDMGSSLNEKKKLDLLTKQFEAKKAKYDSIGASGDLSFGDQLKKMKFEADNEKTKFGNTLKKDKVLSEIEGVLSKAEGMEKKVEKLKTLYGKLKTGPIRGFVANSPIPLSMTRHSMGKLRDVQDAKLITDNLVLDIQQSMKNFPRSQQFFDFIQQSKPGFQNNRESNLEILDLISQAIKRMKEDARKRLERFGETDPRLEAMHEEPKEFRVPTDEEFLAMTEEQKDAVLEQMEKRQGN